MYLFGSFFLGAIFKSFCIKMPFLHRLACFRDDVVFLIYLYQRWIYRVDPKRVNEVRRSLALPGRCSCTLVIDFTSSVRASNECGCQW